MTFVDSHQAEFADHGICARRRDDPEFDRECFSPDGNSFEPDPVTAATAPLACSLRPSEFRPYAPRARWIRTANDSYFTAMTFPRGLPSTMQPSNIHDATWGALSAVYGGAFHPSAEGHAAMADAALPAVARGAWPQRAARGVNRCRRARRSAPARGRSDSTSFRGTRADPDQTHTLNMLDSGRRFAAPGNALTPSFFCRLDDDVVYWNAASCPDRRSGAPSAPSARPRGSRTGSASACPDRC